MLAGMESQVRGGLGVNECAGQQRYTGLTVEPLWPSYFASLTWMFLTRTSHALLLYMCCS